ncbi:hypothetical protein [Paraburkholderia sp. CNPSo 3281]|uniref:hypothetical protein n=1 Tax=Paraburkholderia sp. CNPSo 3281 TaxID=2940933 RepID=UPI0020B78E60|nr:hypothetical protein [Paraburkholderia sp. CNPSo 3281]MCP3721415.1 hypothetical protein [Paraburkholderia sp. CNPSo 3281]
MPYLSDYTGKPLNDFAMAVIDALKAEGFQVATTPYQKKGAAAPGLRQGHVCAAVWL